MAMVHDPPSSFNSGQSFDGLDLPNHKRLSRVNIDEESQLNGSPQTTSSGWSHFPGKLSRVGTAKIQPNLSKSSSWALEVVSLLLATGAMIAMVVLLAQYDDHPLPEWPHDITFNAMIALLATLMTVTLAVPMSNSLSQLKWIRFNTKSSPLTDMELFDDASRGTWGSALLLAKLRGGYVLSCLQNVLDLNKSKLPRLVWCLRRRPYPSRPALLPAGGNIQTSHGLHCCGRYEPSLSWL